MESETTERRLRLQVGHQYFLEGGEIVTIVDCLFNEVSIFEISFDMYLGDNGVRYFFNGTAEDPDGADLFREVGPLRLHEDVVYKTRAGESVRITDVSTDPKDVYPALGEHGGYTDWYTIDGQYLVDEPGPRDLVEVVDDPFEVLSDPPDDSDLEDPFGIFNLGEDGYGQYHAETVGPTEWDKLRHTFETTVDECLGIMQDKNHDYTSGSQDVLANFRTSEAIDIPLAKGILLRMLDKIKRVQTFAEHGDLKVVGEGFEDACNDLINYAILLKHWKVLEELE